MDELTCETSALVTYMPSVIGDGVPLHSAACEILLTQTPDTAIAMPTDKQVRRRHRYAVALRPALSAVSLVAVALTATTSAENFCTKFGVTAPSVSTLMASTTDPNAAWIVQPDCEGEVVEMIVASELQQLFLTEKDIERIDSLPAGVQRLFLDNNAVRAADFTNYDLVHIILAYCNLDAVDQFKFPKTLNELDFDGNRIRAIPTGVMPKSVAYLYLSNNGLASLADIPLPENLLELSLLDNVFTKIDFPLPERLSAIDISRNPIGKIENITMPISLTRFVCQDCGVRTFRGVELSPRLTILDFGTKYPLSEFEIRESDLSIVTKLSQLTPTPPSSCRDPTAQLVAAGPNRTVCVITDAHFEAKYPVRSQPGVMTPAPSATTNSGSNSPQASLSPPPPPSDSSSASSPSTLVVIIAVVTSIVCIVVAIISYRVFCRRRGPNDGSDAKYVDAALGSTLDLNGASAKTNGSSSADNEYLSNDIRNDEELTPFRIDRDDIQLVRMIAKGGFGMIHLGRVRGRDVAVKQLLPERCRDMAVIKSFMDEIRLCARLEHPKIVAFIGVSWTSLLDLVAIIEYMEGGDLGLLLHEQPTGLSPDHWFDPAGSLKPKCLLALDVIEALVYLHSFSSPIIHRDLKARNVLLDRDGDAKLSDFGISREVSLDETMTGEVGTVAWIAPEILQGERYSWKADIYSFGVLLVELDTCRHPYSGEFLREDASPQTNTRIALLVSTGKLVPPLSAQCPEAIRHVAMRCMRHDPSERPSAIEIHYELRKIHRDGAWTVR